LQVDRYVDAGAFLKAAGPWLATAEIENNVILSIASSVADGARILKEPPYFAAAIDGQQVDCCALRTPPWVMLVTNGTARGLAALAADAYAAFGRLPGVTGPSPAAAAYAEAWRALAGGRATISMRQRLHKIQQANTELPTTPGVLRNVTADERALAVEWIRAFELEAILNHPHDAEAAVDRHLKSDTLYFWDIDTPVAMCANAGVAQSITRINLVYTPPDRRRRGYATAAVAALTQQLLNSGSRYCCLYTDLANPTSNSVYRRIGYRPVCDIDQYSFPES
jgi:RimJ/RimL family protein N-acetyltransferase